MQHPPRTSNRNTNSMLNLYLFKGRDYTVTFTRSNQDSRRLWRTVGKPWVSKACPLLRAVLRRPVEPAVENGRSVPYGDSNAGYVLTTILEQGGCCPPNEPLRASRRPEYP